jgi:hypothetical protein
MLFPTVWLIDADTEHRAGAAACWPQAGTLLTLRDRPST